MISIIVAFDDNQLIGSKGALPWHFKEDLKYFKQITMGHTVIMGRVTYESIIQSLGHPLKGRENVVLTKQNLSLDGVLVIHDLDDYLSKIPTHQEVFIIGGASVYQQSLKVAKRLYITHVQGQYDGDTYFPAVDWRLYKTIHKTRREPLIFALYERIE